MRAGAHNADVRIAATNARKIQAALRQGIDAKRVIAAYRRTQPNASDKPAQDRARARAWAMLNMRINNEPLLEVLQRTWAEGFVLGQAYGDEEIARAREAKKAASDYVDWDNWKPGDAATATLLRPPKAFQELLGRARVTIKDLDQTGYDRVGTALADSIAQGLSDTRSAKLINDAIGNPARALTIAITETNRAMSFGAINRYQAAKLEQMEWSTSDPCPECAMNGGQVINIGGTFNSGANMPPAHPHCRCALLPVIPEFAPNEQGVVLVEPPKPDVAPKLTVKEKLEKEYAHKPGAWSKPQQGDSAVEAIEAQRRKRSNYNEGKRWTDKGWANNERSAYQLKADRKLAEGQVVYTNGWTTVLVKETDFLKMPTSIDALLDAIDDNMEKFPLKFLKVRVNDEDLDEIFKHFGKEKVKRVLAGAQRGSLFGSEMWVRPGSINIDLVDPKSNGIWFSAVPSKTTKVDYTITHEWGHLRENLPFSSSIKDANKKIDDIVKKNGKAFLSEYGRSSSSEAYAESWADWVLNKGKTDNPITNAMAKEYGWK
jgi:SPP1 gp7 family putative phage head morphogenesis protein